MTKIKYICKCCGTEYFSYKESSNYCSHDCRIKDNTRYLKCEYCGKEIKVTKRVYEDYQNGTKKHIYCCKDCTDKAHTTKVTKICECCGNEYQIGKCFSEIQKYCSKECYEIVRSKKAKLQTKICPICNKSFTTYHKTQIYCSKECRGISIRNRKTCICDNCGKSFERISSEVDKNKKHYCSKECMYESIRWSVSDISILRYNYRKIKTTEIQKMLSKHYSLKAIRSRAKDYGFAKSRLWSTDEEDLVLNNYESVSLNQMLKLLPNRTLPSIMHKAREFNLKGNFYLNYIYSSDEIKFLEANYLNMSNKELANHLGRKETAVAQKLCNLNLYRPIEIRKSGYNDLVSFMRSRLTTWKDEVRKQYNYRCCLTGSHSNLIIHHCRSFNLLFDETIEIINFPIYDSFETYTDDELILFVKNFLDLQEYYNEYVCISESVHKLFHKEYGYGDNTEEQWEEFVERYKNGYYDNVA